MPTKKAKLRKAVLDKAIKRVRNEVSKASEGLTQDEYTAFLENLEELAEEWSMELNDRRAQEEKEDSGNDPSAA